MTTPDRTAYGPPTTARQVRRVGIAYYAGPRRCVPTEGSGPRTGPSPPGCAPRQNDAAGVTAVPLT